MKKLYTLGIASLLVIVLVPKLALAIWWNPLTWFSHNTIETPLKNDYELKSKASNVIPVTTTQKTSSHSKEVKNTETKAVKKTSPQNTLISEFLKDPTIENFKVFCEKAKSLDGNNTKKVLDKNRENMIEVKSTMYEDFPDCQNIDKLIPLDKNLLLSFESNDPDWLREVKITYNDKVNNLIANSKVGFVSFKNILGNPSVKSPKEWLDYHIGRMKESDKTRGDQKAFFTQTIVIQIEDLSRYFKLNIYE